MTAAAPFRIADHLRARWLRSQCVAAIARVLEAAGLVIAERDAPEGA